MIATVGFTGTRHGMSTSQVVAVDDYLSNLAIQELHHGDCVGADHDADRIAAANGLKRIAHPPSDNRLRAYCDAEVVLEPKPYLDRNRDIVDACDHLIATPAETTPQTKGGTWYTVRYARDNGKPVTIIWPDGSIS